MEFEVTRRGFIWTAVSVLSTAYYNPTSLVLNSGKIVKRFDPSVRLRNAVVADLPIDDVLFKHMFEVLLWWSEERVPRRYYGKLRFYYQFFDWETKFGLAVDYQECYENSFQIRNMQARLLIARVKELIAQTTRYSEF